MRLAILVCAIFATSACMAVQWAPIQVGPLRSDQEEAPPDLEEWLLKRCKDYAAARDFSELQRLHERMIREGLADTFNRIALPTTLRSLVADDADERETAAELAMYLTRWGFSETRKEITCKERKSLIAALDDDAARVASTAVLYLGRSGCDVDEAIPKILALAMSTDPARRREAPWSLALLAQQSEIAATAALHGCQEGPDDARAALVGSLGLAKSGGHGFVELLYELLEDPSDDVAGAAAVALQRVDGSQNAGDAIARQVRAGRERPASLLAALCNMRYHDPTLVPHIVAAMQWPFPCSCTSSYVSSTLMFPAS